MTDIFTLDQIKASLKDIDTIKAIEQGFVAYSQKKAVIPPIGEMIFEKPPGDVHIKYGYIIGDDYYVIKIAAGFYENTKLNIPTDSGLMLVFKQKTGELACILLDEGHLTNLRTAAAGAVVAKYFAPKSVQRIGIFGAGTQGRMQLEHLKPIVDCKDVIVWGLSQEELDVYKMDMEFLGFSIQTTMNSEDIASSCNLIVTATPSKSPLLRADQIRKGTHITAMGSDTPEKNELEPGILRAADIVVADSISQCRSRGEISVALKAGLIEEKDILELGNAILDEKLQRTSEDQVTVADLTGVAVQDIQISKAVYKTLAQNK
ncbi:MAG: ornithine cyclodeaminase family protein [Candidatus Aminicenantes bacterium]|nr:ornithine cyclodeaminase family protein [Candidatus Aminicenantes bacterium]MDH5705729.1 ornithine cyclodeaminase family protein [Candidatus Aminicenantes bacterium]